MRFYATLDGKKEANRGMDTKQLAQRALDQSVRYGRAFHNKYGMKGWAIAVVVVIVACAALSNLIGGGSSSATPSTTPQTHVTQTPAKPAVLGATENDFIVTYSAPTQRASESRIHKATIEGTSITISLTLDAANDGGHVHFIKITGTGANKATMEGIAKHFLPTDAKYQKDMQVADFGTEHVYSSASLAKTFPADMFQDSNGNNITPGTFYVACGDQVDGPNACSLNLGQ